MKNSILLAAAIALAGGATVGLAVQTQANAQEHAVAESVVPLAATAPGPAVLMAANDAQPWDAGAAAAAAPKTAAPAAAPAGGEVLPAPTKEEPKSIGDALGTVGQIASHLKDRDYAIVAYLVITLLVFGLRWLLQFWDAAHEWISTGRYRGFAFAFGVSLLMELARRGLAGEAFGLSVLAGALSYAIGATATWHLRPAAATATSGPTPDWVG